MIQETALRLRGLDTAPAIVVSNESHRFMVAEQLHEIDASPGALLLEPEGRNTAPAVTIAALKSLQLDDDPLLLVLPADHVIGDVDAFHDAVARGTAAAEKGRLVTFGIVPTRPETGYGYIQRGCSLDGSEAFAVERFVEKPDAGTARRFIEEGDYLWNSGMFIFSAKRYLEEIGRLAPDILARCKEALANARNDRDFTWLDAEAFAACPSDSIDYAVMEKTRDAAVVPLAATWSDVGSWESLWEIESKDGDDNVSHGEVVAIDSRQCLLLGEQRLIATLGVDNLMVIDSDDAILVAARDRAQDVKQVVSALEARGSQKHLLHRKVFRPWGHYDSLDNGDGFQVKRITVKPGQKLSLQMHHHRAEHWVVVRGTAKVTRGDETLLLGENESTYIPLGTRHRLENPGKVDLEVIEVQSGSYLGEDDIVRFEDSYGRDNS